MATPIFDFPMIPRPLLSLYLSYILVLKFSGCYNLFGLIVRLSIFFHFIANLDPLSHTRRKITQGALLVHVFNNLPKKSNSKFSESFSYSSIKSTEMPLISLNIYDNYNATYITQHI